MLRHKMKPGISYLVQVNGWRGETDTVDKLEIGIEHDLRYIGYQSLWLDFENVRFTALKGFVGKNAY